MRITTNSRGRFAIDGEGSYNIGDLIERRAEHVDAMHALDQTAGTRALTAREQREWQGHEEAVSDFNRAVNAHRRQSAGPAGPITPEGRTIGVGGRGEVRGVAGERLGRDQRMADWIAARPTTSGSLVEDELDDEDVRDFSLGRLVRGMVSGRWDGAAAEQRALAEGVDATGGFVTPEILSGRIIDLVRNRARVIEAGAEIVPVESDKQSIPRISSGVTPSWKLENDPIDEDQPTFERVTFEVKTLPIIVRLSQELFEDMIPEAAAGIERDIVSALALELDRVALEGSGVDPEPQGLINQPGVTVESFGNVPTNYAPLIEQLKTISEANHEANGILLSAATEATFAGLTDLQGQPLQAPAYVQRVPRLVTNQAADRLFAGSWSNLLIGVRPNVGVRVKLLDQTFADNLQVGILAWLRADIQLAHPEAFHVYEDVLEGS